LAFLWRRAPELVAAVWVGLVMLGSFTPLDGYDWIRVHVFYKSVYASAVWGGEWTEWNPAVMMGRPLLADIEGAFFYPLNVVFLLGSGIGALLGMWLHAVILIRGCLRLGDVLGVGRGGAWFLALSLLMGAPLLGRLQSGQFQVFCTLAWWPWLLVGVAGFLRDPRARSGLSLGAIAAFILLAGSPPMAWIGAWLALGFAAVVIVAERPSGRWIRWVGGSLVAGGITIGLSAVALVPFLELIGQGNRLSGVASYALADRMEAQSWWSLLRSRPPGQFYYWEYNLYIGLIAIGAAIVGLVGGRRRWSLGWATLGLIFALLSLGRDFPLLGFLVERVPGWDALRYPSRYAIVTAVAILMLAAEGFRFVATHRQMKPSTWRMIALGLILLTAVDLFRASWERAAAYAHAGPAERERWWRTEMQNLDSHPGGRPLRVLAPNWVLRENVGMIDGHSMVTGFANPALAGPWQAVHRVAGVVPDPEDPVNLSLEIFRAQPEAFIDLSLDVYWDMADDTLVKVDAPGEWLTLLSTDPGARAELLSYEADKISLQVSSIAETTVVLADPWYPGWQARSEDESLVVERVEGWKRGITVPAGNHEILLEFQSRWLRPGALVSAIAVVLWTLAWWRTRDQAE